MSIASQRKKHEEERKRREQQAAAHMPAVQHPVVEPAPASQPQPQRFIPSYASQAFEWASQENYRHDESERQEQEEKEAIERLQPMA